MWEVGVGVGFGVGGGFSCFFWSFLFKLCVLGERVGG